MFVLPGGVTVATTGDGSAFDPTDQQPAPVKNVMKMTKNRFLFIVS